MTLKQERRAEGRCIHCGEPALPRSRPMALSVAQKRARESGKPLAYFTHGGFCAACIEKRKASRARNEQRRQDKRESEMARRKRASVDGLCCESGCHAPRAEGKRRCPEHLGQARDNDRARYAARRAAGLCPKCGEKQDDAGYVLCVRCRNRILGTRRASLIQDRR